MWAMTFMTKMQLYSKRTIKFNIMRFDGDLFLNYL